MKKILLLVVAISASISVNSQSADEIIANYFENTGGIENWAKIEGIKMSAKAVSYTHLTLPTILLV